MKLKEKDNVPLIRFDYFKEEWDKKLFKDFTKLSQGLQIAISSRFLEDGEDRYFYITNEFLNPNSTKKYYIESPSENVICTVDDILMTRTGNTGKVITNISGAFHNNFFKVDYDKFETSKMFLYYLLTSNDIHKEIIIRAGNSTIPDLNHSDFYSIKTSVPSLDEQSAIGSLFRTLDHLLASYNDNLANYQSLKATMLSKMFPKAGQTLPEIRLDGFEGEWEIVKLGDNCRIITGGTPKTGVKEFWNPKGIPWMSSGEINKKILNETEEMISYIGLENSSAKWVKQNSVLIALAGQGQTRGRVAINKIPLTTNQSIAAIETNDNIDFLFLYTDLSRRYDELRLISSGDGTRGGLNKTIISNLELNLPTLEEQQAIGSYFSNLDYLINSHQEKISQLETLKKKLLQDMFV